MKGRTYRYAEKTPLYPFGYGLSYTRFAYRDAAVSSARVRAGDTVTVSATVENVGNVPGDEVVQLYVKDLEASCAVPVHDLRGFTRVHLGPGEAQTITFDLAPRDLMMVNDAGKRVLETGPLPRDDRRQPARRAQRRADRPIPRRDRVRSRRLTARDCSACVNNRVTATAPRLILKTLLGARAEDAACPSLARCCPARRT